MSKHAPKQSVASPFASLVQALAHEGPVVVAFDPRTQRIEARLEHPLPAPQHASLALADGDASDRHIGITGATRGD